MAPTPWGTLPVRGSFLSFFPGHSVWTVLIELFSFDPTMQSHRKTSWHLLRKRGRRQNRRRKDLNSIASHLGLISRPHSTLRQPHSCHIYRRRRSRSAPCRLCRRWSRQPPPPPIRRSSFRLYLRFLRSILPITTYHLRRPSFSFNKPPASAFRRLSWSRLRAKLLLPPISTLASSSMPRSPFSNQEEQEGARSARNRPRQRSSSPLYRRLHPLPRNHSRSSPSHSLLRRRESSTRSPKTIMTSRSGARARTRSAAAPRPT